MSSQFNSVSKRKLGVSIAALLAGGLIWTALADEAGHGLSPSQILGRVHANYAAMTTYSDEGAAIGGMNGKTSVAFTTRLARTNFYLIEWRQNTGSIYSSPRQAVWSSGAGNYLQAESGVSPQGSRHEALDHTSISGTVPRVFFNEQDGCSGCPDGLASAERQADDILGNIDCYVLAMEFHGSTNFLWIGKQSYLIYQIRTVISTDAIRSAAAETGTMNPDWIPFLQGYTWTETHTNIIVNLPFSRKDFAPSFPLFDRSDSD